MSRTTAHELDYSISRIIEKALRERKVTGVPGIISAIMPDILEKVPSEAFEATAVEDLGFTFYHGAINRKRAEAIQGTLLSMHYDMRDKRKPITLYLSSIGGSDTAGMAIMSTIMEIQRLGREVNIHVQGGAYSMGAIILQAGSRRSMEPFSFLMVHSGSYEIEADVSKHEDVLEFIKREDLAIAEVFAFRTGKTAEYWLRRWERRDLYLSAKQALDEGLVDEIYAVPDYKKLRRRDGTK